MTTTNHEQIGPVELTGEGYRLTITEDAEARKEQRIAAAAGITEVTDDESSNLAQFEVRKLAEFRNEVERSRKEVKAPVLDLGRRIDQAAKDFANEVTLQETRLKKLVGDHAREVERKRREAEAEERRRFEEAQRAKREAEEAERKAAEDKSIKAAVAKKEAERAREKAEKERLESSEAVATTNVSRGVKFVDDFEITDIAELYKHLPECVRLTPVANEIKQRIAWHRQHDEDPQIPGVRVFRKPKVSTR